MEVHKKCNKCNLDIYAVVLIFFSINVDSIYLYKYLFFNYICLFGFSNSF